MPLKEIHRRGFLLAALPLLTAAAPPPIKQTYIRRSGFFIRAGSSASAFAHHQTWDALAKQIDIVAATGVKKDIMDFFQKVPVTASADPKLQKAGGGVYANDAVVIGINPLPSAKNVILLHELLPALHHGYLDKGNANADVEDFYQKAKDGDLYPHAKYMMKNKNEFFAVSASLYLVGTLPRPPSNRDVLRDKQPNYFIWLGDLFGLARGLQAG